MDILLVSSEDTCRSRIAQELLASFGRGMKFTTSGAIAGHYLPELVLSVLQDHGHDPSRKPPTEVDTYVEQPWDCIITLTADAEEKVKDLGIKAKHYQSFEFEDPMPFARQGEHALQAKIEELYATMYRQLYRFYRDILSDLLMPSCTCGANTYCRCE